MNTIIHISFFEFFVWVLSTNILTAFLTIFISKNYTKFQTIVPFVGGTKLTSADTYTHLRIKKIVGKRALVEIYERSENLRELTFVKKDWYLLYTFPKEVRRVSDLHSGFILSENNGKISFEKFWKYTPGSSSQIHYMDYFVVEAHS